MRLLSLALTLAFGLSTVSVSVHAADRKLTKDLEAIAYKATIYAFPMVDNARIISDQYYDTSSSQYKAPVNTLKSFPNVAGPDDTTVQTINADTPYSYLLMDLRTEPMIITMPAIEKDRYYSVQLIDLYTHNFDYLGTRKDGNTGGSFMVVGPNWKGSMPAGVKRMIRSETEFAQAFMRTQLKGPQDLAEVKKIQDGYKAQTLSSFLGKDAPTNVTTQVRFPTVSREDEFKNPERFFSTFNYVMTLCPPVESEKPLLADFARIGLRYGENLSLTRLSEEQRLAVQKGFQAAMTDLQIKTKSSHSSIGLFGTRQFLKGNYLNRAVGALMGIYGNSKEEAVYLGWATENDNGKTAIDTSKYNYTLKFAKNGLPPAHAFWSVTMYNAERNMIKNSLNRNLINSAMLPQMKKDQDGGYTIYVQKDSPGANREANWLPAPNGPLFAVLRMYMPSQEVQDGKWKKPAMKREASLTLSSK